MALKFIRQTKAEIPAELESPYVERGGASCLDVDGAVDRAKLERATARQAGLVSARAPPLAPRGAR